MKVRMTTYGLARSGKPQSEDTFAAKSWDDTVVAVLADGVGSARHAREASGRIVHSLIHHYVARPRAWSPDHALGEFVQQLNRGLFEESQVRYGQPEMVSTIATVVIENGRLYGLNAGDSRIYLCRSGELTQLSTDHLLQGQPHGISRAVGLSADFEPQTFSAKMRDADVLLLCSDGVSNHLSAETLRESLAQRHTARTIVQSAREKATPQTDDDMSAIVIDVLSAEPLAAGPAHEIVPHLNKGEEIDGYLLQRAFQNDDRVWLATKDGARFVLKFAPREAGESEEHLRQFQREIFNATRVSSDLFPHAERPAQSRWNYYVMPFIEAPPLNSVLKQRTLAVEEALALARFLCRAGQELAGIGLVHGDVKPENILIGKEGDALSFKLLDLGSALDIFTSRARAGTASYLAPERFGDAPATERTEIFAIGVTLFQALTRTWPYGEIERFQTPRFRTPKRLLKLNPLVPASLEAVLLRAISVDPAARYETYSELLFDLDHPEAVTPFTHPESQILRSLRVYRIAFFALLAAVVFYALIRTL